MLPMLLSFLQSLFERLLEMHYLTEAMSQINILQAFHEFHGLLA